MVRTRAHITIAIEGERCTSWRWQTFFRSNVSNGYIDKAGKCKHYFRHQIESQGIAIERRQYECCTLRPWPTLWKSRVLKCEYLVSRKLGEVKSLNYVFYRIWYSPSNPTIVNVVCYAFDSKKNRRQRMSPANLPLLALSSPWSCSCWTCNRSLLRLIMENVRAA